MFEDYFCLGKITKKFGLKGELVVYLDTDEPEKYHSLGSVFFDLDGEPIPFFIKEIKIKNRNQLIILFQDVDDANSSYYINTDLYLPLSMLPKLDGNKFYYHEIKGFTIIDKNKGNIGVCNDVIDYVQQAIMQIVSDKGEILIPIVDNYIKNVNRENHTIEIESPPGLIELYVE
jgi:16S rRNA processing protein RimM